MKNEICKEFMPKRATTKSAGYDIYLNDNVTLKPGEYTVIDTGIVYEDKDEFYTHISIWEIIREKFTKRKKAYEFNQYVGLIFPRSSYGFAYGLRFANSICVIDQDYRNTIKLSVTVDKEVELYKGDRIAQMIFIPWLTYKDEIKPEDKRTGGIGSTGN